jgi:hypothetical protein
MGCGSKGVSLTGEKEMPPRLDPDIYGADDLGAAHDIDTKLSTPDPTLDEHGESDERAKSEGNHGAQS